MYNIDRRSKEFNVLPMCRLYEFEEIFILKDSSYAFAEVGFRTKLYLLDEARRKGVLMDDGEEDGEELDYGDIIAHYGAFGDDAVGGDDEEEAAAVEDVALDADPLGDVIRDAQRDCESEKEKGKFERMLEDHRNLLYPTVEDGQKKAGYNT